MKSSHLVLHSIAISVLIIAAAIAFYCLCLPQMKRTEELRERLDSLEATNQVLSAEIEALRRNCQEFDTNPDFVTYIGRKLGLANENEVVLIFPSNAVPASVQKPSQTP